MNIVAWICVTGVCVCTYRWHHFITALHYIAEQRVTVRSLRCHVSFCETWVWICLFCLTLLKLEIDIRIVYKTSFLVHSKYSISSPQNKIFVTIQNILKFQKSVFLFYSTLWKDLKHTFSYSFPFKYEIIAAQKRYGVAVSDSCNQYGAASWNTKYIQFFIISLAALSERWLQSYEYNYYIKNGDVTPCSLISCLQTSWKNHQPGSLR